MTVSKKFIYIIAAGALICIALYPFRLSVAGFVIYNCMAFGILLADFLLSPGMYQIKVARSHFHDKLSVNTPNAIPFLIQNHSGAAVTVEVQDHLPDWHFQGTGYAKTVVQPQSEEKLSYFTTPGKRGAYRFGDFSVRVTGRLGLVKRQFLVKNTACEFKVYPNLELLGKYRLIVQKNLRLSDGRRPLNIKGMGTEFEGIEEYTPGDDFRKINWKATARANKLVINQYGIEKNQPVFILLDSGRSMSYQVQGKSKLDYAINASLILSDIVNQKGDQSGLMVFDTEVSVLLPPGHGGSHRLKLMDALYHVYPTKMTADFKSAFLNLTLHQKRRSLVCIFTDFDTVEEAEELRSHLPVLAKKHIPMIMLIKNEELEAFGQKKITSLAEAFQGGTAVEMLEERRKIVRTLNSKGAFCVESPRDKLALTAVNQYLTIKNKNML